MDECFHFTNPRMSQRIKCPRCGRLHSAQSLDGACPECLVRISLGDGSAREEPPKEHGIVQAEVLPPEDKSSNG